MQRARPKTSFGKRVPLSVTPIMKYAHSYLLSDKGGEGTQFDWTALLRKFLMKEKKTPLEGELLSRDCLKRLLVLKQLCNLMKDYGRKSLRRF